MAPSPFPTSAPRRGALTRVLGPVFAATFAVVMAIGLLTGLLGGCAKGPEITPRQLARATVLAATDIWVDAAIGCKELAQERADDGIRQKCLAVLGPMKGPLLEAASLVDTFDDAAQKRFPCVVADIYEDTTLLVNLMATLGMEIPPAVEDALGLAKVFVPQCIREAGPPPAPAPPPPPAPAQNGGVSWTL